MRSQRRLQARLIEPAIIGAAPFTAGFADLADKIGMSESHCVMYLHRRVIEAENAARRGRWVGGKVYNFLTGSDAEHVAISGAVLVTVYRALDRQPPIELHAMGEYVMRYPDAKHLKTAFEAKMKEKGVIV